MVNNGTAAAPNWQSTVVGSGWSLTGNSGTDQYRDFIGSTDNTAIKFRVANVPAGTIDPNGNVFWGLNAGVSDDPNKGYFNVGLGSDALRANTTGLFNVGIGGEALSYNVSGYGNVAVGNNSLLASVAGNDNVAIGGYASDQNQGSNNVAVGNEALFYNVYDDNVAVGYNALGNTRQAGFNTAIGYGAGSNYDNGYNNVFIGANTGTTGNGFYNCIAIGQDVYCTDNSQVRIGNAATTSIGGYVGWSTFSDGRIKKDISENVKGLDFILKLRPVTYRLDLAAIERRRPSQGHGKTVAQHKDPNENEGKVFSGFIAQEVEKAAQESGYDFGGIDKPKNADDLYTLRYADFVAPLVKAVQEMNARVDRMEKENEQLKQQIKNR
jgi:trimeric autotransporter adhesin